MTHEPGRAEVEAAMEIAERYSRLPPIVMVPGQADLVTLAAEVTALRARSEKAEAALADLLAKVNSPVIDDFIEGVTNEAAHQIERWGASHDAGKEPQDWFWLLGWLAGKAVKAASSGDLMKAKHHTISSAAALLNWHRALSSDHNEMRPGIDPIAKGYALAAKTEAADHG